MANHNYRPNQYFKSHFIIRCQDKLITVDPPKILYKTFFRGIQKAFDPFGG